LISEGSGDHADGSLDQAVRVDGPQPTLARHANDLAFCCPFPGRPLCGCMGIL
jgi:hypothetical protein